MDMNNLSASLSAQFRGLNGRHPGQWPIVPRVLSGVAVFLLVLLVGWYFYWSDQQDELNAGEQKEVQLKEQYKSKIQQAINLDALQKQKLQVADYVATLEKQLPSKAEMDALLFKPGQVVVKDYYAELPINIKVTGNYHDVGSFASDIANLPRIVTLNNMNLTAGKDGALSLDAIAKTFRYLDKDEVAAQRKVADTAKQKGQK
jgi:type IV pilus assembly protein PilO